MSPEPQASAGSTRSVSYDPAVLRSQIVRELEDLLTFVQGEPVRSAVGREPLRALRDGEAEIRAHLDGDFTLAVIGDFKRGKSTLINALLGAAVVPTSATPETATINELVYGPELRAEARLRDGGRVTLQPEELRSERLATLIAPLEERLSHLRIEAPVESLRGLKLVDTPGTGDVLHRFDERVSGYLSRADAVLCVLSAVSPLSETEQSFLRMAVAPHEFPRVLFVVNMMDIAADAKEADRLLDALRAKLRRTFPSARVYGVSALDELGRQLSRNRPNPERATELAGGFEALRAALGELIEANRTWIQLDRVSHRTLSLLTSFVDRLRRLEAALQTDAEQLRRSIEECEDRRSALHGRLEERQNVVRDMVRELGAQTVGWLDEFMDRYEVEVIPTLPGHELDDLRQHFPFFLSDTLRQAVNQCVQTHEPAMALLVREAEAAIRQDYRQLAGLEGAESGVGEAVSGAVFADLPWNLMDTVHLFVEVALGLVFATLMGFLKNYTTQSANMELYQQRIREALPALREALREEVGQVYAKLARELEAQLQSAYEQELEATLSAMRQAEELLAEGDPKRTGALEALGDALRQAEETRAHVQELRERLAAEEAIPAFSLSSQ